MKHVITKIMPLLLYAVFLLIFLNDTSTLAADGDRVLPQNEAQKTETQDKLGGRYYLTGNLVDRTFILYEIYKKSHSETLLAGPYYEVTRAGESQITQQKAGAALYWTPVDSLWHLTRPKLVMVAGISPSRPKPSGFTVSVDWSGV